MAVRSLAQSSIRQNPQLNSMLAGYQTNQFHHLETVRLGGNAAFVEFTNLSRYADYQHFQIRGLARCTNSSTLAAMYFRLNGDSGANYSNHRLEGVNNSMGSNSEVSSTNLSSFYIPGNTAAGSSFSGFVADIIDPFEVKNTTIKTLSGFTSPGNWTIVHLASGAWYSTAAVSSISVLPNQSQFLVGSRFSLYGIKARA